MSGKVVEFGIRITADGKVAVVEAAKVEKALGGVEKSAQGAASAINGIASASNGAGTAAPGLRPAVEQIDKLGMSAKQTAFAMRQVPMQFTDIIVSLQAGQNPMQVALQQGAQLKDSFGGIGPAALALGRYVGGLINPFTIAAAAAVALAVAYKQGSSEATAYTKAIIMSGNAAGVSSDQLASMAAAMSQLSGTQGKAAEVLAALVSTGRVASASLQSAAQAAIDLDTVGGQSIEDTVKHFTALGQAPVAATLKLNEGLNYLTATTYRQIKAAEEAGDKDRAAEIAQEAYASALGERAGKIQTSLGLLERAWNGVWGAGKRAWDAMRDVGRPELLESKLATAQRVLANAQKAYDEAGPGARNINTSDEVRRMRADQLKQALDAASAAYAALAAAQEKQEATAAEQAKNVALNAAKIDLDRFTEGFKTKAEQGAAEITKAKGKILAAAGLNTQSPQDKIAAALGTEEAEKLLAAVRQKYAEKAASASDSGAAKARAALESEYRMRVDLAKRGGEAEIAALSVAHETGAITEEEYQAKITRIREAAITEAIRLTGELYAKTGDADKRKELILQMQALTADWVKTEEDGAGRVAAAHMKWAAESGKSVDAYIQSLEQSASAAEAANAVYGATDEQVQRLEIARLNDALATAEQGKAQLALVDASPEALAAYQAQIDYIRRMIDARTRLAGAANIKRERDQNVDMWRSIEQAAHTTWTSISKDGKNAFTQIGDTLKAAILDVLYQMTVKKWIIDISASISGSSVAGAAFASGGAGGGAGGGFGGIFNAFSAGSIPSLGTAIGNLSTIGPTFSAMLDSGAGFFDSASAAMTGMGSSFAAVTPYLGAGMQLLQGNATGAAFTAGGALAGNLIMPGIGGVVGGALGSLVGGLFGGGGEDPHNNADASGVGLLLSKAGVGTPTGTWGDTTTGFNGQSPFTFTAGQTSGEGRWADSYAMSEAQIQEITKQVAATFTAGASIAKLLGVDQSVIDSASVSSGQFASVEDALSKLSDEIAKTLIPNIADFQASGEALNQTLMRVATNVQAVNVWSGRLGLTLDSIASKNSLASQFGGAAGMDAALQNYYQSFYSDAERQAQLAAEVAAQFAAMNLSMPTSIAGFRALVSGLDLTTAAGQQTFTELIGVSSAFAQVATTAGGLANSVSTAFDALKKSVDAQRTLAQAAADAAQQQVDQVKSVFDVLTSSINGIYNAVGINAASANAFIDNALANAQKSGYLPESGALSDAISSVSASYGQKVYATEFQRQADQLVLAGKLSQLKDITGSQLTIAEQALNAAKTQLTTLDNILSNSQAQIDQLNGINTSVLSVADAVANLATAMNAQAAAQASATIATAQAGATSATAAGQPIYTQSPTAAALAADPAAMAAFAAIAKPEAAAFGADGDAYIAAIRDYTAAVTAQMAIWQAQTGSALVVQARAGGGYTKPGKVLVGERGPELVDFASPGMVYTAQQTAAILSAIPTANNMGFYSPGLDASPASFSPPGPFAGRLDHLQDQLNSRDGDLVRLGELIGQLNAKMAELISISKDSRREQRRTNDALTGAPLLVTTVA